MATKKKILNRTLDMILGPGEDTTDVTEQVREHEALGEEITKLEGVVARDLANETDAERLTREFGEFKLTPLAKALLARACENVASNMGSNTMDDSTQKQIQERAALFAACDNNLASVVDAICDGLAAEDPRECSSVIYSTCFAVQKAANFIANLWYRRALDPVQDEDLASGGSVRRDDGASFPADQREELRDPIIGLGPENVDTDPVQDAVDAYEEVHTYLQLMTEVFGWDPDRSMPYCFVTEDNGATFTPITDAMQGLDISEVKSRQARKRREVRQTQALAAALAARRKLLKAAA